MAPGAVRRKAEGIGGRKMIAAPFVRSMRRQEKGGGMEPASPTPPEDRRAKRDADIGRGT
jgi:hypothetical protein